MVPGDNFGDTHGVTEIHPPRSSMSVAAPACERSGSSRILVVEDHTFMRRNIVAALERENGLKVCGEAEDVPAALAAVVALGPDVVLTDIVLRASSGLELVRALREQRPALPVVVTTMFDVRASERQARAAGAVGFVSKQDGPDALVGAIRAALKLRPDANANL